MLENICTEPTHYATEWIKFYLFLHSSAFSNVFQLFSTSKICTSCTVVFFVSFLRVILTSIFNFFGGKRSFIKFFPLFLRKMRSIVFVAPSPKHCTIIETQCHPSEGSFLLLGRFLEFIRLHF